MCDTQGTANKSKHHKMHGKTGLLPRAFSLSVVEHELSVSDGCSPASSGARYQPDQSGNQLCSHQRPPTLAVFVDNDTSSVLKRSRAAATD